MDKMDKICISVNEETEDERLDKLISSEIDTLSRSYLQKIIKDGQVSVNGLPAVKSNYRVQEGDEITVYLPKAVEPDIQPEEMPLDILYEDKDILVINKPKGLVVHPAPGHYSGTLVNGIMYHCKDSLSGINGVLRPGIVHRIDKDTTGSLLICKNDIAHAAIAEQLKEHTINRNYLAIVHGKIKTAEGTVNAPIGRNPKDRKKMSIRTVGGREAITHYTVLEQFSDYTYIEFRLETGRTHQIRVHMTGIGHPLLGDEVYGVRKSSFKTTGQTLHALSLGFVHPTTGKYLEFTAPIPEYFEDILNKLRTKDI